jgi:4-aminobutyrate aminotransferase / (S)-3-amino-2-methylpropionate transaminase / 5-aminovalerate transaminase
VLDVMAKEDLPVRAARMGANIRRRLCGWAESDLGIGDVRGLGAMIGLELVQDRVSKAPDAVRTGRVLAEALRRGLLLLSAGTFGNVVRILVPLTADEAVVEEGLDVMREALAASRTQPTP